MKKIVSIVDFATKQMTFLCIFAVLISTLDGKHSKCSIDGKLMMMKMPFSTFFFSFLRLSFSAFLINFPSSLFRATNVPSGDDWGRKYQRECLILFSRGERNGIKWFLERWKRRIASNYLIEIEKWNFLYSFPQLLFYFNLHSFDEFFAFFFWR